MKFPIAVCTTFLVGLIALPSAHSQDKNCEKRSAWLDSVQSEDRDLALIKISSNTIMKFTEIAFTKNAKPSDQLWGYKILSIGHNHLAESPYASQELKTIMRRVEKVSSGIIRGEIDFNLFKNEIKSQGQKIDLFIAKRSTFGQDFLIANREKIESMSNCILIGAMAGAMPSPTKETTKP